MQVCKGCGKEVKYIASKDTYTLCDAEEIKIMTESGFLKKGYKIHDCKGRDDGGREKEEKAR